MALRCWLETADCNLKHTAKNDRLPVLWLISKYRNRDTKQKCPNQMLRTLSSSKTMPNTIVQFLSVSPLPELIWSGNMTDNWSFKKNKFT